MPFDITDTTFARAVSQVQREAAFLPPRASRLTPTAGELPNVTNPKQFAESASQIGARILQTINASQRNQ